MRKATSHWLLLLQKLIISWKCNHSSDVRVEEWEVIQERYYSVRFSLSSPCSDVELENEFKYISIQKCLAQASIQNVKRVIDCR